jgi:hypothetical protein
MNFAFMLLSECVRKISKHEDKGNTSLILSWLLNVKYHCSLFSIHSSCLLQNATAIISYSLMKMTDAFFCIFTFALRLNCTLSRIYHSEMQPASRSFINRMRMRLFYASTNNGIRCFIKTAYTHNDI